MSKPRSFLAQSFYHIISRGNNRQNIFLTKRDNIRYLKCLEKYAEKFNISIITYCLMPNHVHLLIKIGALLAIPEFMQALNTAYTKYFNARHSASGHLFEGPYKHVLIETDEYLVHLSRYIHLNPTSSGLVKTPENYEWSSYRHFLNLEKSNFIEDSPVLTYFSSENPIDDYKEFVESRVDHQKEINFQKFLLEKN